MAIIIGIILAGFLSLILVGKKNKSLPDRILLVWLITIGITLMLFKLQTAAYRYHYPFFLGWGFPFPLLQWPFLYVYVLSLTSRTQFSVRLLVHFLPFVLSVLLFSPYFSLPNSIKIDIYNKQGVGYETEMTINLIAIILSAVVYTILSSRALWKYKESIQHEFSYMEKITLNWLLYLIAGMTLILLLVLLGASDELVFSSITGIVVYIGYFGIKQVGVFYQHPLAGQTVVVPHDDKPSPSQPSESPALTDLDLNPKTLSGTEKEKYEKSRISEAEITAIHQRLNALMRTEKLYTNPELTLSELAQKIPVHPNTLSQVINTVEGKNFFDYINFQRVEEFKRLVLLPENSQYTLLALAYECGFNSKTSFNRNFKKATGLSPSAHIMKQNIRLQG